MTDAARRAGPRLGAALLLVWAGIATLLVMANEIFKYKRGLP